MPLDFSAAAAKQEAKQRLEHQLAAVLAASSQAAGSASSATLLPAGFYTNDTEQGHCSSKVTDENFKISLPIQQVLTPRNSVSALCIVVCKG